MPSPAAVSCDVLIGSRGWEHQAWSGPFYPDDLPPEWRLTYYANAFRSVLVPAERLQSMAEGEPAEWREDVPEGFVFYLEVSPDLMARMDRRIFLSLASMLEGRIGGVLFTLGAQRWPSPEQLEPWLSDLAGRYPLGGDFAGGRMRQELLAVLDRYRAGETWRPGERSWSERKSCIGLLSTPTGDLRRLREHVQSFAVWASDCPQAFLCFGDGLQATETMKQARVIAELLGG